MKRFIGRSVGVYISGPFCTKSNQSISQSINQPSLIQAARPISRIHTQTKYSRKNIHTHTPKTIQLNEAHIRNDFVHFI